VRKLSGLSEATAHRIAERVEHAETAMQTTVGAARQYAEADAKAVAGAERAIQGVLERFRQDTEGLDQSARLPQSEGRGIRDEVEKLLVALQFQDRMSQILRQVMGDMDKLHAELRSDERSAAAFDTASWLAALEGTYATQEQRVNHGRAAAGHSTGITFF
jgi:methyl-accepting chemotaxis protein